MTRQFLCLFSQITSKIPWRLHNCYPTPSLSLATDGFAIRLFQFASEQERNRIFERWDNVDASQLKSAFGETIESKVYKGGTESIYSKGTWRDWQALLWWARNTEEGPAQVRAYLEDESKSVASIGKHVSFLWHSLENTDGRKIVETCFHLLDLRKIAKRHASTAQWTNLRSVCSESSFKSTEAREREVVRHR